MIEASIRQARARLFEYSRHIEAGGSVTIGRRNTPIAVIQPAERPRGEARPIGRAKGMGRVPRRFFGPLAEGLLDLPNT